MHKKSTQKNFFVKIEKNRAYIRLYFRKYSYKMFLRNNFLKIGTSMHGIGTDAAA